MSLSDRLNGFFTAKWLLLAIFQLVELVRRASVVSRNNNSSAYPCSRHIFGDLVVDTAVDNKQGRVSIKSNP